MKAKLYGICKVAFEGSPGILLVSLLVLSSQAFAQSERGDPGPINRRDGEAKVYPESRNDARAHEFSLADGTRAVRILQPCEMKYAQSNFAKPTAEHKQCLDALVEKLRERQDSLIVIDGHRDKSERPGISLTRAINAHKYLKDTKGVDAALIEVRNFGDTCAHESGKEKNNRRLQFWILPKDLSLLEIDKLKKCRPGSVPTVIDDEEPALQADPHLMVK